MWKCKECGGIDFVNYFGTERKVVYDKEEDIVDTNEPLFFSIVKCDDCGEQDDFISDIAEWVDIAEEVEQFGN